MELDGIAVFVKVVQAGSFSQAAKSLGMPKTTVSAKVASLEKSMGVTLIHRTTRKLHVTDAGEAFFKRCVRALEEIHAGELEVATGQEKPQGLLRVTAPADLGHSMLPAIVCAYRKQYPSVQVELIVTNRMVDLIAEGVDLAIRAGPLKSSSFIAKKFFDIQASFWASPGYLRKKGAPSHPRELSQLDIVLHSNYKAKPLELTDGKASFTLSAAAPVIADDFETVKSLILLGEGIGWCPSFLCEKEDKKGELVKVLPKWQNPATGVMSFVYPEQRFVAPKVRAFMSTAEEFLRSRPKT